MDTQKVMGNLNRFELDRIAFIGRTYPEYMRMFALEESLLKRGPVLDCPGGSSSFVAEACEKGFGVTACDILYNYPPEQLFEKGEEDIALVYQRANEVPHLFRWDYYKDRDELITYRNKALELFIADYPGGRTDGRYVQAELPNLPFVDRAFTLVLSSHFLFLYGDRLSFDFHITSLKEMVRVSTGEVRVYPLQGLDAQSYLHMDKVLTFLRKGGIEAEMVKVPFEFQRGSTEMLKLRRGK
jgi:hypothetical protein